MITDRIGLHSVLLPLLIILPTMIIITMMMMMMIKLLIVTVTMMMTMKMVTTTMMMMMMMIVWSFFTAVCLRFSQRIPTTECSPEWEFSFSTGVHDLD